MIAFLGAKRRSASKERKKQTTSIIRLLNDFIIYDGIICSLSAAKLLQNESI
jgi:hypothetical protein